MTFTGRRGFTLVELLVVLAIMSILLAITVPGLLRARGTSEEASAVGSLRAVYSGEQAFWSACGFGNYAPTLQNLGTGVGSTAGFISPELSGPSPVVKSGYRIDLGTSSPSAGTSCNGSGLAASYHTTADPLSTQYGVRFFGGNSDGTLYESTASLTGVMPDVGVPPAPAHPLR